MTDVIILSDDDFSPSSSQRRSEKRSSGRTKDKAAKQWDDIFSQGTRRERRKHESDSQRSSHRSERSSKPSSDKSSKSHRSSERHSRHSSSRGDKERHRGRSSSGKSVVVLDVSDEDEKSSGITSKKTSPEKVSSGKSSKESSSRHRNSESSSNHHHSKSSHNHHSKRSSDDKSSSEKNTSGKIVSQKNESDKNASKKSASEKSASEKSASEKNASEKSTSEKGAASRGVTANGRHSGSRRSLAAELGVSKAECKTDSDEQPSRRDRPTANGKHSKADAESASDTQSRSKRLCRGAADAVPAAKRVRLTRVDPDSESDASFAPPPEPEPEPPEPCQQSLEELCALLKPLLSGPELRLEAKVRRRHAAVLTLAAGRSGRRQHLTGVTQQCTGRLRAEPERCFTVLRGFLEQLDQIKIVASSAQSRTAPAAAAAGKVKTGTAAAAAKTAATVKKPMVDAAKASPSALTKNPEPSVALSEQDEKETRRHRRHVAKLEKTLRRLEREIVRQDEQEVDWDDAAGSAYMVGARLKRRYVQVYRYYCKLVGAEDEAQRLDSRRIRFDGTRYPEINRRIEKFVNQTREFPDFKDVLSLIETANRRGRLKLGPGALNDQAKEAFLQLGALLQKRRRAALVESMDSIAGAEEWRNADPAAGDAELGGRLAENATEGKEKLNGVFREFVQRQETAADERRQKRADPSADSDEEEEEEEEEEEDTEGAEESEVTDEELEQQTPKPTRGDVPASDMSDEDGGLSDAEMAEADDGPVKEELDGEGDESKGKESESEGEEKKDNRLEGEEGRVKAPEVEESKVKAPEGKDCAKTEESVDDERKVKDIELVSEDCGGEEQEGDGEMETDAPDAKNSRDPSAENGSNVLEAGTSNKKSEDNADLQGSDEDVVMSAGEGCDVPEKSLNVVDNADEPQTENGGSAEAEDEKLDPVQEPEKSGSPSAAE